MFTYLTVLLGLAYSFGTEKFSEICAHQERDHYLNFGQNILITDKNVSFARSRNPTNKTITLRDYCVLEIETCTSCLIFIKFRYLNLKATCGKRLNSFDISTCRCDYIWIAEPAYEGVSGKSFCGYWNSVSASGKTDPTYRSQTRSVTITFFYMDGGNHEFAMYVESKKNQNIYYGKPHDSNWAHSSGGILTSPFFPAEYPPDVVSEYIVTCLKYPTIVRNSSSGYGNPSDKCRIHLLFTDFLLGSSSVMEFFEGDQQRIELTSGASFRPHLIVTNSSRLKIRFSANGGQSRGFKALFSFVQGNQVNSFLDLNTDDNDNLKCFFEIKWKDCGGMVEDLAGVITMVNMVPSGRKLFDCIWLIRPPQRMFTIGGNLYLKVNTFLEFDFAELEIREGQISDSPLLEKIFHSGPNIFKEHITSSSTGFYVNLRASFGPSSVLGITFASFHFNKCFTGPEFLCQNHRCISRKTICDGFDHCGDNSDESQLCYKDWMRTDRKWERLTPNYYFPKVENFAEIKTATLVFIGSSLGVILFLAVLIILLYRMGSKSRQDTDFQNRLQTITEFLDDAEIEEIIDDEPPNYEAPPDYEVAVMKIDCILKEPKIGVKKKISEGNVIIIIPEGTANCSGEILNEGRNISPPPPYMEDSTLVVDCTSEKKYEDESASVNLHSHLIHDEDDSFNSSMDDKLGENA